MSDSEGGRSPSRPPSPRSGDGRAVHGRKNRKRKTEATRSLPKDPDLILALGLWALAFLHRALFLASNVDRSWGFSVFYEGDSETFYNFARAILAGVPYDGGIPFHPPLWPHVLSWIHMLVGAGDAQAQVPHLQVKLWTAVIGSSVVPLFYLLARRYLGRGVALLSALLAVYSFGLYVISVAPVTESLYGALLFGSLLVLSTTNHPLAPRNSRDPAARVGQSIALRREPTVDQNESVDGAISRWLRPATLGILLGLLCLTRAEGALLASILVGLGLVNSARQRSGREAAPWMVCALSAVLVITPWTIRNGHALEAANVRLGSRMSEPLPTFVPITAYGPLNFALANNSLAEGPFSREILTSGSDKATLEVTDPQHLEYFLHGYEIGFGWIRSHPGEFLRLVVSKWRLFFGAGTLGFTQWDVPGGLDGVRRPVDLFVPNSTVGGWILFPLVALGAIGLLALGGDRRRWVLLGLLVTAIGMIASGLFFGYARLGVLVLPFWLSAAGAGIVVGIRRFARSPWTPGFRSTRQRLAWVVPIALLLLLEIWGATGKRNFEAKGTQAAGATHLNPHDTMYLEVIRSAD